MAVLVSARGEESYVPVLAAAAKAAHEKDLAWFGAVYSVSGPVAESLKNKALQNKRPIAARHPQGFSKHSPPGRVTAS